MRSLLILLLLPATLSGVTLQWDAPADTTGIIGYRLYWGTTSGTYNNVRDVGMLLQATVDDAVYPGGTTLYFVARSYSADNTESANSNQVTFVKPTQPPTNLRFMLNVVSGSGDGEYEAGTIVTVKADKLPRKYRFAQWIGDTEILTNPFSAQTTAIIPEHNASIQATYERR
jgi:hypothetical protein